MTEQNRVAQLICSTGGDGLSWTSGNIFIGLQNLWQVAPRNLGIDGYNCAYFVEAVTLTVTDGLKSPGNPPSPSGYGTGAARRMAGFRLYNNGASASFLGQSPLELYGGQVYPDFSVSGNYIVMTYNLTNTFGYYFHARTFVRIIAHEPIGTNFKFWY